MRKAHPQVGVAWPAVTTGAPRLQRDIPRPGERAFVFQRFSESYYFCPETLECGVLSGGGWDDSAPTGGGLRDSDSTDGARRDDGRPTSAPTVVHRAECAADFNFPRTCLPRRGPPANGTARLRLRHAVLNVSGRCNLDCQHCLVDGAPLGMPATDMSPETAMRALECIEANRDEGQGLVVSLYGGEPLLNPALLHTILDRHDEILRGRIGFWLCTNGSIFDEEIFEKLIALDGTIVVSVGFAGHPGGRPSSRFRSLGSWQASSLPWEAPPEVQENIDKLLTRWPDRIAFVASASRYQSVPQSLYQGLPDSIRERLTFRPWIPLNGQPGDLAGGNGDAPATGDHGHAPGTAGNGGTPDQAEAFARAFLERIWQRQLLRLVEGIALDEGFHRYLFRLFWRDKQPWHCGAAASEISVAPDGRLYPCVFFAGCQPLAMGDVFSGLDFGKLDAFFARVSRKRQEVCTSCWARPLCDGGCPRRDFDLDGSSRPAAEAYCRELKATISRAIALYASASQDGALLYLMGLR